MDQLIDLLNSIDISVVFKSFEDNGEYNTDDVDFIHIIVDPNCEYNTDVILKHEAIHALQHEYHREDILPFPTFIWNKIKPPAKYVQQALKKYKDRYEGEPICLVELQAMALEDMSYDYIVNVFNYIVNL